MRKWGLRLLKLAYIGLIASLPVYAMANYAATVGAGTNFGSVIIGGVHFASQLLCDMTTANQCASVSAGGSLSVALAANQSVNEAQINGVTPLMGNGVTGTGSQRVTIASDNTAFSVNAASTQSGTWTVQPGNTANTTAWLMNMGSMGGTAISSSCVSNYGTPPSAVACPSATVFVSNATPGLANNADAIASVAASSTSPVPVNNYAFVYNGTTWDRMRSGTTTGSVLMNGAGTLGTPAGGVLTIQGGTAMTKVLVTPDSVALPANQSVNLAQVAGATTAVGSGVQATALRTTLATDSPGIVTLGPATAANSVPMTIGPTLLGSYCMGANTGTMAAGLAGGSPIFSFRYGAANLAIIRRVSMEADDITTAFVAGAGKMDMFAARSFTASDSAGTAGTLTGNNGKLRTSFATTGISDFRISSTATLTAGTRTLDAQPLASTEFSVSTSIDAQLLPTTDLFRSNVGESPFVLAQNEGFVVQATVPGTGTWVASVRVCWDEVSAF